jgi:hypothetical protein
MFTDNLYKLNQDIELLTRATKRSFDKIAQNFENTEDRLFALDAITLKGLFNADKEAKKQITKDRAEALQQFKTMEEKNTKEFEKIAYSSQTLGSEFEETLFDIDTQLEEELEHFEKANNDEFENVERKSNDNKREIKGHISQRAYRTNNLVKQKEKEEKAGLQVAKEGREKLSKEVGKTKDILKINNDYNLKEIKRVDDIYEILRKKTQDEDSRLNDLIEKLSSIKNSNKLG